MLITGSTGSGKSTTMISLLKQAVEKGKPVTFFDFKGETGVLDELEEFCNKLNVPFYEFSRLFISEEYVLVLHVDPDVFQIFVELPSVRNAI